ncbi:MAG TPA: sugar transferase [Verrucomicrobiae bacterium]|jgi:exopolysaccharide biosynthesis polyprenyl glycosylphosphotransferase|nr:sugar transferase [Verrucomicrobiae bacterium]
MLRRHRQIKTQIQQAIDAGLFGVGFWIAWLLRSNPDIMAYLGLNPVHSFGSYFWLYFVLIFSGPLVLEAQGFYDRPLLSPRRAMLWPLFKGCLISTVCLIIVIFFLRLELARAIAIMFGLITFCLILLKEELARVGLRSKFAQSQLQRRFILVGTPDETARMREDLTVTNEDGVVVFAELDLNQSSVDHLSDLLHEHSANGVILSARHNYFEKVESAISTCEQEGVEVWLIADIFKAQISRTSFDDFHGRPVLIFRTAPEASWQRVLKQCFDYIVTLVALVPGSILFGIIALLIKLTSPGPILFRQQRCGLNGQPFTIFKFRTMVTDAEQRQHELAAMNEMSGPVFKMTNDPRITTVGKWLRKFSFDELPQLFNVLRGEMSIVGPRPLPVDEVKRFDDLAHRRRLSVKPGLTCLWQISGRNNVSDFKDWVRLDLEYIDNWSLWLDLKIIWRTIPVIMIGTGAK